MRHRLIAVLSFVAAAAITSPPRVASTCSPAFDYAVGPEELQAYDATMAPSAPVVASASVTEVDSGAGCGGGECGFTSLDIELGEQPAVSRLQITFPDGTIEYAQARSDTVGPDVRIGWPGSIELPADIAIATVDDDGFGSVVVETTVRLSTDS